MPWQILTLVFDFMHAMTYQTPPSHPAQSVNRFDRKLLLKHYFVDDAHQTKMKALIVFFCFVFLYVIYEMFRNFFFNVTQFGTVTNTYKYFF